MRSQQLLTGHLNDVCYLFLKQKGKKILAEGKAEIVYITFIYWFKKCV